MGYLNALASGGLSVGLRFYAARLNELSRQERAPAGPDDFEPPETAPGQREEAKKTAPAPPPPQTEEEVAAGRAEARARLEADGRLGHFRSGLSGWVGEEDKAEEEKTEEGTKTAEGPKGRQDLTEEEKTQVQELKQRDREVHAHEAAHQAASGGLAGSPSYTYQTGPDGQKYAVGGEVAVHSRGSSDPAQALRDAEAIKRGATAPAEPSSQDRAVAASASADINRLRAEVQKEKTEKTKEPGAAGPSSPSAAWSRDQSAGPNGASFEKKVAGAYAAVKFGFNTSVRSVLARA
jgi:hypothetical protein